MEILPYEDDVFYDPLGMKLWENRYYWVQQQLENHNIQRVLDLGCSEGKFTQRLSRNAQYTNLYAIDIDEEVLKETYKNLNPEPIQSNIKQYRKQPLLVKLFKGSALIKYQELKDLNIQAIVMIELIEHLHKKDLPSLCENVFGFINPQLVIVTTPNFEFNQYFKQDDGQPFRPFRHWDHKYEFNQKEFQDWAYEIKSKYNYKVEFSGIGQHKIEGLKNGYCSQAAIFIKQQIEKKIDQVQYNSYNLNLEIIREQFYDIVKNDDLQSLQNEISRQYYYFTKEITNQELDENIDCEIDQYTEMKIKDLLKYDIINKHPLIQENYQNLIDFLITQQDISLNKTKTHFCYKQNDSEEDSENNDNLECNIIGNQQQNQQTFKWGNSNTIENQKEEYEWGTQNNEIYNQDQNNGWFIGKNDNQIQQQNQKCEDTNNQNQYTKSQNQQSQKQNSNQFSNYFQEDFDY